MEKVSNMNSPIHALLIVDLQPTFCEGGSLPVVGGNRVAEKIASFVLNEKKYQCVITTQDWHIAPGEHFSTSPDYIDTWPEHGLADSDEAQLHPALNKVIDKVSYTVKKGKYAAAYSGFEGVNDDETSLDLILKARGVTHVDIVGLALDYCVKETAIDSVKYGYQTRVLTYLSAAVAPDYIDATVAELKQAGVKVVQK